MAVVHLCSPNSASVFGPQIDHESWLLMEKARSYVGRTEELFHLAELFSMSPRISGATWGIDWRDQAGLTIHPFSDLLTRRKKHSLPAQDGRFKCPCYRPLHCGMDNAARRKWRL